MTVYDVPGLCGLELWRGIARGAPLFQLRERRSEYFEGLREFLLRLHHGRAAASVTRETAKLRQAAGFQRLVLCGGEALDPSLERIMCENPLPFSVEIDKNGPYAAKRGALHIFRSMGWQRGVALDLGQIQLKVITDGSTAALPRDTSKLPFGARAIDTSLGRARLRSWLEEGLSQAARHSDAPPDGVVLALPVALRRDGVAEPATYPGLFGPLQPLFSGLIPCPSVVLNDAILAGVGFPPKAGETTLVVTLGFGVGGALWLG